MQRCLQLASNGLGKTYPNPLVGSVIVCNDQIIGEGWHQKAGTPHAEVHAINSVKNQEQLKEATLYVNLEPCSHYGKTPPCSDLIIEKGIKKVVIGSVDPNPKVAGRGVNKLMEFCDEVIVGCMEEECENLNKRFFTYQRANRPYVILKWAQTQDGFMAPETQEIGKPTWITNPYSKQLVHQWRSEEQGILVGVNTALKDNPKLSTRLWRGNSPVRIIIDPHLKTLQHDKALHLLDRSIKTIVFCDNPPESGENLIFESIDFSKETPEQILSLLYEHNLQSVIIEGGQTTLNSFIQSDLWDEARVFTGQSYFGKGIKAPLLNRQPKRKLDYQGDMLQIYKNE